MRRLKIIILFLQLCKSRKYTCLSSFNICDKQKQKLTKKVRHQRFQRPLVDC